jgi:hypothetical protein
MRAHALTIGLAVIGLAGTTHAQQITYAAGSSAAPWIKLASSARLAAMGDAGSALVGELDSQNLNPAALAGMSGQQFTLMHNIYVLDSSLEHVGYGMQLFEGAGLALSGDYLNFGAVDKYKVVGSGLVADGSVNPSAWAANLGYGQKIFGLALGANVKMISQDLGGAASSAFAGDLGLQWSVGNEEVSGTLAAAYQNVGTTLDGAQLPQGLKLGARVSKSLGFASVNLLGDFSALEADAGIGSTGLGLELMGKELYALRGGYKLMSNGGAGGLTLGGGLRYSKFSLDYAFVSRDGLGASNQISLGGKF